METSQQVADRAARTLGAEPHRVGAWALYSPDRERRLIWAGLRKEAHHGTRVFVVQQEIDGDEWRVAAGGTVYVGGTDEAVNHLIDRAGWLAEQGVLV